jgi:hypothetical protein
MTDICFFFNFGNRVKTENDLKLSYSNIIMDCIIVYFLHVFPSLGSVLF